MDTSKISATILTGFLGSGKTTMVRHILDTIENKRLALIINEFGDLGMDSEFIQGCGNPDCVDDIVELTNGCICCTVADDFIPTMTKLLESESPPDHILIETSGLALPQPLVNAFNWPAIRERVRVDGVITLVDSPAVQADQFADNLDAVEAQRKEDESLDHESPLSELFEDQIRSADLVIMTKTDMLSSESLDDVNDKIQKVRKVPVLKSGKGSMPSAKIILGSHDHHSHDDHHHHHHHDDDHDHDEFASFIVEGAEITSLEVFQSRIVSIMEEYNVLRLKGFVAVSGKDMRLVVQAVGSRLDVHYDRDWRIDESRISSLVVIGLSDWDQSTILTSIKSVLQES